MRENSTLTDARHHPRIVYEFLYTSIGQAIAAYSPNELFAAMANPVLIGCGLIPFSGVLVPYSEIQVFWRYWLYYINPFTYMVGALVSPVTWDVKVKCKNSELAKIPLPSNSTCGEYMSDFLSSASGYLVDPSSTTSCEYCEYSVGSEYLKTLNINHKYDGWRDVSSPVPAAGSICLPHIPPLSPPFGPRMAK